MKSSLTRAQFLRGDWRGENPVLRPPWALSEPFFSSICDGCGECVSACETSIISISSRGLPQLDFSQGSCTFCGKCTDTCETGALQRTGEPDQLPWQQRTTISDDCLAKRGTSCVCCIEACEHDAILFRPILGGRTDMQIDSQACTGCGACYAPCPVGAIIVDNRPWRPLGTDMQQENTHG